MQIKAGLRAAPGSSAATAAAGGDPAAAAAGGDEEDTVVAKGLIISYCALDYPRIVDSVRWRLATIRKNLQVCWLCAGESVGMQRVYTTCHVAALFIHCVQYRRLGWHRV